LHVCIEPEHTFDELIPKNQVVYNQKRKDDKQKNVFQNIHAVHIRFTRCRQRSILSRKFQNVIRKKIAGNTYEMKPAMTSKNAETLLPMFKAIAR